jgi:hypothetical protein
MYLECTLESADDPPHQMGELWLRHVSQALDACLVLVAITSGLQQLYYSQLIMVSCNENHSVQSISYCQLVLTAAS